MGYIGLYTSRSIYLCIEGERQREGERMGRILRFILRNWLTCLWGLASWKCIRQASSRLATQLKVDASVLSPNAAAGRQAGNSGKIFMVQT